MWAWDVDSLNGMRWTAADWRPAGPDEKTVCHLHVRDDASCKFASGCGGIQTALRARDRGQGRCCRLVYGWPCGQRDQSQRHGLAKVPAFRRIITSRITEPEKVHRYSDPARYLPNLVDGKWLLPAQHVARYTVLRHSRPRRGPC